MNEYIEKIALSALGAFVGFVALGFIQLFFGDGQNNLPLHIALPILLVLGVFIIGQPLLLLCARGFRSLSGLFGYKRIAILNMIDWDKEEEHKVWTNVNPIAWNKQLYDAAPNPKKLICKKIKRLFWIHSYHVVINPCGGVYYEKDFDTRDTMRWILSYISKGGLFVSVADVPLYYAYDKKIERTRDAGMPIYRPDNGEKKIVFGEIPFLKALGLKVIGLPEKMYGNNCVVERLVKMERGIINLFDPFIDKLLDDDEGYSPFFISKFDKGRTIISMLNLNENPEYVKKIADAVINEIA